MASLKREDPQVKKGSGRPMRVATVLAAMGPGLIAALSGTDAGGIATYSNAGALFGFGDHILYVLFHTLSIRDLTFKNIAHSKADRKSVV